MAKKQPKLLTIYDNLVLRTRFEEALDDGTKYEDIVTMCKKNYGIDISISSVTRYAQKREEAVKTGQDLRKLLDSDTEKALTNIKKKKVNNKPAPKETPEPELVKRQTYSLEAMLDILIQQGFKSMVNGEVEITPKDFATFAKLFTQINGNNNHGLTTEGLQQLRLFQNAVNNATARVITKYVPKESQSDVIKEIKEEERRLWKELDTSENGKALMRALDIGNVEI